MASWLEAGYEATFFLLLFFSSHPFLLSLSPLPSPSPPLSQVPSEMDIGQWDHRGALCAQNDALRADQTNKRNIRLACEKGADDTKAFRFAVGLCVGM